MSSLSRHRIRLKADWRSHNAMVDVLTNAVPILWRGTSVDVEVGLFDGSTFVDTITNIASLALEIHYESDRQSGALVSKTLDYADLVACTENQWNAGTHQHATFELSKTDTNFDLSGSTQNKLALWVVIHAVLTDGTYMTLGATQFIIEEDAAQLGLPVLGTVNPNWRVTTDGVLAIKNKTSGLFHEVWIEGTTGAESLVIGEGQS